METLIILLVAAAVFASGSRIVNQYERAVFFRLQRYQATRRPGLFSLVALIEWQATADPRVVKLETAETPGG